MANPFMLTMAATALSLAGSLGNAVAAQPTPGGENTPAEQSREDYPKVEPADLSNLSPDLFSDDDLRPGWMTRPLPYYLAHLAEIANSVITEGDERGWINRRAWRGAAEFRERDARVMENVLSLVYFYTRDKPWNPHHGDRALRQRLELALSFYLAQLGESGLMKPRNPDQHVGFRLANSMFFTKFMGEALVLLSDGPLIDATLHQDLLEAQRRALRHVLTSDLAFVQGRQFSNQFGNIFGGAYAYLYLTKDDEIRSLLEEFLRSHVDRFQSPAGFPYENHSVDFGYSLGTHHSNVHAAWHYAKLAGMEVAWLKKETALWAEWLAYNSVPSPDFSHFYLNRAIEARQDRSGFDRINAPFARYVPGLRPFVSTVDEVREEDERNRARIAANWPRVDPLGTAFSSFSPYAFLHRDHFQWHPTDTEREAARQRLPYLADTRFTHQRVDGRRRLEATFIRRPGYYAVFNAGEQMSAVQTFGLGLLWHPEAGAVLQSQTRMPEAAWGVVVDNEDRVFENQALTVRYFLNGEEFHPLPGNRDLSEGVLEIHYRVAGRNEKFLRFDDNRVLVVVNPGGDFTEQIPLLTDASHGIREDGDTLRVPYGVRDLLIRPEGHTGYSLESTDRGVGLKRVTVLRLEGQRRLTYSLEFVEPR